MLQNKHGNGWRFINRDGSMNVRPEDFHQAALTDLYHLFLSMRWRTMFLFVTLTYLMVNVLFGSAYFFAGPHALNGTRATEPWAHWIECFFFSVQTLATIGYGGVSPNSLFAHLLVTIEALVGLIGLALITGIVFSRFARPTARVRFSDFALITRIDGKPCLVFRMANTRLNQIAEAQVRVVLARYESTEEGTSYRELYDLRLERDRSPLFSMTWMIVHTIDKDSPLLGQSQESIRASDTEIITTMTGTDETFSQTVHSRFSYAADDLKWNVDFEDMISRDDDGYLSVRLEKISTTRPVRCCPIAEPIQLS